MNAVRFQATVLNGVITLPGKQKSMERQKIKVILLDDAGSWATDGSATEATSEADFFSCAGIWGNRDGIIQESIRTILL